MSTSNDKTSQSKVKYELKIIIDYWIRANKLRINCNKNSFIMLNKPDIATFDISNYKICEKNDIKYLSITLDNKLS